MPVNGIADSLEEHLGTGRFGHPMRWLDSVGSTNEEALSWAKEGAPEGALVGTDHQSAGRGRHGRSWFDSPGHNLLFSIVLRPLLAADRLGLIPLASGLAVAEAIEEQTSLGASLKWPNDVLVGRRKVCGMLMEGHIQPSSDEGHVMVLGVGLNVNQIDFPREVVENATSLALESGQIVARPPLLAEILYRLDVRYDQLCSGDSESILRDFEARISRINREASIAVPNQSEGLKGVIMGLADDGGLRIRTESEERVVHAGDVSFSPLA